MGQGLALSIKERRRELGLTQAALASAAKVSLRTLKAWEAGEASPSLGAASRLAAALGISLDDLADPART
jgi:transcriptional regulator with XRE-family HTH domain